jgi:hypothetical protein
MEKELHLHDSADAAGSDDVLRREGEQIGTSSRERRQTRCEGGKRPRPSPRQAVSGQANTISALKEKKFYQAVESGKAAMTRRDGTLLVKAKVTGMRIVSGHARMWGGAFTGSSFMEVDLTLIDAATNTVVREKKLSSANNPWAAAWVGGASDHSLPADTGRMLAEYVHSVMPKK